MSSLIHLLATSFIVGIVGFALGGGYGTILVPVLILYGYEPKVAILSVLICQFIGETLAAYLHHKFGVANFNYGSHEIKNGVVLGICGIIGSLSVFIVVSISSDILIVYNVITLICLGLVVTFARIPMVEHHISMAKVSVIGTFASVNKALTGGNYGPTVLAGSVIIGANIKKTVATISLAEAIACAFAIIGYICSGIFVEVRILAVMCLGTILSVIPSVFLVKNASQCFLKKFIGLIMILLGMALWINNFYL